MRLLQMICIVAAGAVIAAPQASDAQDMTPVATGFDTPWGVAILPDGSFLVTERPGRLLHVSGDERTALDGVPEVYSSGQGGLLDVTLPRDFETTREVLLTYSKPQAGGGAGTALAVGQLSDDATRLEDVREGDVQPFEAVREQLREDLQQIFRERNTVIVYATTEPLEALTLGGTTAVMHEGRLIQHGATPEVYHRPAGVAVSQVFSDPPMNLLAGELRDGELALGEGTRLPAPAHLHELPPGRYRFGIRPGQIAIERRGPDQLALTGEVEVAELAGSETYIHVRHGDAAWVVQVEGVHPFGLGDEITVYMDPQRLFAFDADGRLAAAPARHRPAAA